MSGIEIDLINFEKQKKHWFCFSFIGHRVKDGVTINASVILGLDDKKITKSIIDDAKTDANVYRNAVILSVSYLGEMTQQEYGEL